MILNESTSETMIIGSNNLFEVGSQISNSNVGDFNTFEIKSEVKDSTVCSECVVGVGVQLKGGVTLSDRLIAFSLGSGSVQTRSLDEDDLNGLKSNFLQYLTSLLDKNSEQFISKHHQLVMSWEAFGGIVYSLRNFDDQKLMRKYIFVLYNIYSCKHVHVFFTSLQNFNLKKVWKTLKYFLRNNRKDLLSQMSSLVVNVDSKVFNMENESSSTTTNVLPP